MKIYKMTATFGKLQNETLTLKPGLNVIEAPNEWGKSTWCAFIVAMLYGISSSDRTKKDSLAAKEHYSHVVIMGGNELAAGEVKIKNLQTREEATVSHAALGAFFD